MPSLYLKLLGNVAVLSLCSWVAYKYFRSDLTVTCWKDYRENVTKCRPLCAQGLFSLPSMATCRQWLICAEINNDIKLVKIIGQGAVKQVYFAIWNNFTVVVNKLRFHTFKDDFEHGLKMIKAFQPHKFVVQLLGFCGDMYVTEYHPFKSLDNLEEILSSLKVSIMKPWILRFQLCIDYVEILAFLHNSTLGTRVMCDSNDLTKTMSQYLIKEDMHIVVNDLDALPLVDVGKKRLVRCGHRELFGDFVAPEQLWPYEDKNFTDGEMPGYNQKTDIWKIPDVCNAILGIDTKAANIKLRLLSTHSLCKSEDAINRPTAVEVLMDYHQVWEALGFRDIKNL